MRVLTTFGFVIATCQTSSAALAYEFNQPYIKLGAGLSAPGSKQVRPSTNRGLEGDWRTDFDTAGLYEVAAGWILTSSATLQVFKECLGGCFEAETFSWC